MEEIMLRRSVLVLVTSCLAATTLFAAAAPVEAAVAINTIKSRQNSATEALEITVLSVSESTQAHPFAGYPGCTRTVRNLTVTAKVDVVRRSTSGLQPGNVIVFDATVVSVWPCAIPGGNFGQMLSPGDRVEAYLRPAGTGDKMFLPNDLNKLR